MEKDFDEWNSKKKQLDVVSRKLLFKEGEIWWCSIGVNVGEEVYGKGEYFRRPVVILRKLSGNTCIVMPTTTRERKLVSSSEHPKQGQVGHDESNPAYFSEPALGS